MGLLSTLRTAPKSATIRAQLEQNTEQCTATDARLAAAKDAWRKAVLDGTDAEKVAARATVRGAEEALEELRLQRSALETLLAETEAAEAEQAAQQAWDADVKATRDAWAKTEKLLGDYQKQAASLVATLRALSDIHDEWSDIVRRRTRLTDTTSLLENPGGQLIDAADVPAPPGTTRRGVRLFEDEHLRYIPRLDEGKGAWFQLRPY